MSPHTTASALAEVTAAMVEEYDVVSSLTHLASACAEAQGAHGVGVMVLGSSRAPRAAGRPGPVTTSDDGDTDPGRLELLAAASHTSAHLDLFRVQVDEGPCRDAVESGAPVSAIGAGAIAARWPELGRTAVAGGVTAVWALPMRWRGTAFGSLTVFRADERPLTGSDATVTQTFADLATLMIRHARSVPLLGDVAHDVREALDGRVVIEQAKGVVMAQDGLDAGQAFEVLQHRARAAGSSLSVEAQATVARAAAAHGVRSD